MVCARSQAVGETEAAVVVEDAAVPVLRPFLAALDSLWDALDDHLARLHPPHSDAPSDHARELAAAEGASKAKQASGGKAEAKPPPAGAAAAAAGGRARRVLRGANQPSLAGGAEPDVGNMDAETLEVRVDCSC